MERDRIIGDNWRNTRLFFDDTAIAEHDESLVIEKINSDGVFSGSFEDSDDELIDGRFIQDGLRPRIVYVRRNPDRTVITRYSGRVIELDGETTVMIRGKFSRATTNGDGSIALRTGDHETEKPT